MALSPLPTAGDNRRRLSAKWEQGWGVTCIRGDFVQWWSLMFDGSIATYPYIYTKRKALLEALFLNNGRIHGGRYAATVMPDAHAKIDIEYTDRRFFPYTGELLVVLQKAYDLLIETPDLDLHRLPHLV